MRCRSFGQFGTCLLSPLFQNVFICLATDVKARAREDCHGNSQLHNCGLGHFLLRFFHRMSSLPTMRCRTSRNAQRFCAEKLNLEIKRRFILNFLQIDDRTRLTPEMISSASVAHPPVSVAQTEIRAIPQARNRSRFSYLDGAVGFLLNKA